MPRTEQDTTFGFSDLIKLLRKEGKMNASKTADAVFDADLSEARKVEIPEARKFFDSTDKVASQQSTESGFTIDEPKEPNPPRNFLDIDWKKESPGTTVENSPKEDKGGQERTIGKLEEMNLKTELRNAVDQYNELIAKAVRLKEDIENKGGADGEIPKTNITDVLEDPRLHDPRVSSSVKSNLLRELTEKLKNENSISETEEYENIIKEIEPAKGRISDALGAVLAKTFNSSDVERIRLSMAGLVVEDDVTLVHKQDWEVICINRKAEINEEPKQVVGESENQVPVEDIRKEKGIGELPNVSPGIVESIDEIGKEKSKEVESDNEPVVSLSKGDHLSAGDKEQAVSNSENSLPEPETLSVPKATKFEEFVRIGPDGNITAEVASKSAEAGSTEDSNLSIDDLAKITKGDGQDNKTGIVNLSRKDLETTIEVPNPTHLIRDRVEVLKQEKQVLPPGDDLFGLKDKTITDIDRRPLEMGPVQETVPQILPETAKEEDELDTNIVAKEELDSAAGAPGHTEPVKNDKPPVLSTKPAEHKKIGLFGRLGDILALGKGKGKGKGDITTDRLNLIEKDVIRTRSSAIEESAEQTK